MSSSPFDIFRRNQRQLMVAVTALSMFAFIFLDSLTTAGGRMPLSLSVLIVSGFCGLAGWYVGSSRGRGGDWAAIAALIGALVAFIGLRAQMNQPAVVSKVGEFSREQLRTLGAKRQVANQFIARAAQLSGSFAPPALFGEISDPALAELAVQLHEADAQGVQLNFDAVNDYIRQATQDRLSEADFRKTLRELRVGQADLFEFLRDELRAQLVAGLARPSLMTTNTSIIKTPAQYWKLFNRMNIKQTISVLPLPVSEFVAGVAEPKDSDLVAFFEANREKPSTASNRVGFMQPRKVRLAYVAADFEAVERQATAPTDEEIREYYEKNKWQYPVRDIPELPEGLPPGLNAPEGAFPEIPGGAESAGPAGTPDGAPVDAMIPDNAAPPAAGLPVTTTEPATAEPATTTEAAPAGEPAVTPATPVVPVTPEAPAVPDTSATTPATPEAPAVPPVAPEAPAGPAPETPPAESPAPATETPPAETPAPNLSWRIIANTDNRLALATDSPFFTGLAFTQEPVAEPQPAAAAPVGEPVVAPAVTTEPVVEAPAVAVPVDAGAPATTTEPVVPIMTLESTGSPESPATTTDAAPAMTTDGIPAATAEAPVAPEVSLPPGSSMGLPELALPGTPGTTPQYRELDDNLKLEISERILKERTFERLGTQIERAQEYMLSLAELYLSAEGKTAQAAAAAEISKKLKAFAESNGLRYVETDLLSELELARSSSHPIGQAREAIGANNGNRRTVSGDVFSSEMLYSARRADAFTRDVRYAYWKLEDVEARVPLFTDPGIREEVLTAWKTTQAQERAAARGAQLADLITKSTGDLPAALAGQTTTGTPDGSAVVIKSIPRFSWLTMPELTPRDLGALRRPMQSVPIGLLLPGNDFFELACERLAPGEVGVAANADKSIYYVMKVLERDPALAGPGVDALAVKAMQDRFMGEPLSLPYPSLTPYDFASYDEVARLMNSWQDRFVSEYAIQILNVAPDGSPLESEE